MKTLQVTAKAHQLKKRNVKSIKRESTDIQTDKEKNTTREPDTTLKWTLNSLNKWKSVDKK